ncbi:hypothetical protein IFM89_032492 [Coptis chinensis]|uniref:Bifunctional inhibitor/plant lipid transfer protein/seed storage helical domain-containing protein n=1 Tax=Coptis chinensis TaxID=261450 RepID=A0A835IT56_9MAGN|nr:hypothetical protein IFM89_032492 [Coptis chinensis]
MEATKWLGRENALLMMVLLISIMPSNSQITTPCTASMISSFTPCMNFITGSTANGSGLPTSQCCGSVRTLLSSGMDCACLLLTANVPFQLPINRTLSISLPRACKVGGVPVQCKGSAAPLPSQVPVSDGPSPSPSALTPTASSIPESTSPALAPQSDTTDLIPTASSPADSNTPVSIPGRRPVVTPNAAAKTSHISSPYILFVLGVLVLNYY